MSGLRTHAVQFIEGAAIFAVVTYVMTAPWVALLREQRQTDAAIAQSRDFQRSAERCDRELSTCLYWQARVSYDLNTLIRECP